MKKKKLTKDQEFDIMKLVLDKFLWLGFGVMAFGLYKMFLLEYMNGLLIIVTGAIILIILMCMIVREYEVLR